MENKNKLSSNYKDYKYVYTGYKDYLNEHNLDKQTIEKNLDEMKTEIDHDHNYKFDFNNPNEHQHDYSFDFNNPNEHQHDYSFDFNNPDQHQHDYSFDSPKEMSSKNNNYNSVATNNFVMSNNTKRTSKLVIFLIISFYILFFIIYFISEIFYGYIDNYDESNHHNDEWTYEIDENI